MKICEKCKNLFKTTPIIDGKKRNFRKRKFCLECFSKIKVETITKIVICKNCNKETKNMKFCSRSCSVSYYNRLDPKRNPTHHCKNCQNLINCKKRFCSPECKIEYLKFKKSLKPIPKTRYQSIKDYRKRKKDKSIAYKGGKCSKCFYKECIGALSFHHIDPSKKEYNISSSNISMTWNEFVKELDKCILLCGNCHREEHSKIKNKLNYRQKNKIKSLNYLGGKCIICGYDKCFEAIDFHYIDPSKKEIDISRLMNRKFNIIKNELDKCISVCSNCHHEIHYGKHSKYLIVKDQK